MPFNLTETEALASQIFDPKNRAVENRIISNSTGISDVLVIYTFPDNLTSDQKLNTLAYMTAFGRSEHEGNRAWASWMYSYICMCFGTMPQLIGRESTREYTFRRLPLKFVQQLDALSNLALNFEGSGENTEYAGAARNLTPPLDFPELASSSMNFPEELAGCATIESVYGYCGLLVFMAGKKITADNFVTITERRPDNLMKTYGIPESAMFMLSGEGQMNRRAHTACNQAWVTYAGARKAIITDVASFGSGETLPQRVVYTISKLLENVGMQSAHYIHRFLQAFPEAKGYKCLGASLSVYSASVHEVAKVPSRLQPYYKVIHGDLSRAFHRNQLVALAACAISFEQITSPSMRHYNLGEGATLAIAMFDAEATRHGHQTLGDYVVLNKREEETVAE